ncbi:MAG: geranylgeranylglycerol-phosphate geranylgeranyltransferase [Salinivirgaceae bacterium]|jgi:4-hydroxybenzoate polyprenyltransferase|nr:geranylgeranylglycerol-phosphate geranylgeranyltransferase [Salinivirgaceae bacterium]
MLKYLKLIRLPNLLMVPITMYLLRYGIIEPALHFGYALNLGESVTLQFPNNLFLILVIINVLLGAAGYVINDYFDRKIDFINRPNKVIIGNTVHRRFAIILHFTLTGIALFLAIYLSWVLKNPIIAAVYFILAGIFWLYSTTYKKQFLIGNLVVSFLTALVPLQVAYFELIYLNAEYGALLLNSGISFKIIFYWLAAFALFAFLTNLLREIIKDIEDFEGDSSYGCNTIPVVIGVKATKIVSIVLTLSIIWLLGFLYFKFLNDPLSKWYLLLAVALPLLVSTLLITKAKTAKQYHAISWLIKLIMLTGVLYALVAKYIMENNF